MVTAIWAVINQQIMEQAQCDHGQAGQQTPPQPSEAPTDGQTPEGVPPEQMQQGMEQAQGMDLQAMGNMEGQPMTDPMLAPEERPNGIRQ
jgi:hypothetical protein